MTIRIAESVSNLLVATKYYFPALQGPAPGPGVPVTDTLVAIIPIISGGIPGVLPLFTEKDAVKISLKAFALNPSGQSGAADGFIVVRGPQPGTGLPVFDGTGGSVANIGLSAAVNASGNLELYVQARTAGTVGAEGWLEITDVELLSLV